MYVNQPMLRRRMIRATIRPKAVAAANPTTARIQTALEFPLNIDGLHDLKFTSQMIHLTIRLNCKYFHFRKRKRTTYGKDDMVASLM